MCDISKQKIPIKDKKLSSLWPIAYGLLPLCFMLFYLSTAWAQSVETRTAERQERILAGKVQTGSNNTPVGGVSISIKSGTHIGKTNNDGYFEYPVPREAKALLFSKLGYKTFEYAIDENGFSPIQILLDTLENMLDEAVVVGYGSTTRRMSTGSVVKVTAREIENQPISNPMLALQGLVPGLEVTPSSGINGAAVDLKIRGTNSLTQGSEPFVLVDGNPIAVSGQEISMLVNATSGISIFNSLNPSDIESIEILKDADATAIYGSRGANGVILITTKKGGQEKTNIDLSLSSGFSSPSNTMEMLNTQEYFLMRKEALKNSGLELNEENAPDLFYWDDKRDNDFRKFLSGASSNTKNMNLALRGGAKRTSFRINAGFYQEGFQVHSDKDSRRFSLGTNLHHTTSDDRFVFNLSTNFSENRSNLTVFDPSIFLYLPPHALLYEDDGSLNWQLGPQNFSSVGLVNPYGQLENSYRGDFKTLLSNLSLSYKLADGLTAKLSAGYTHNAGNEYAMYPSAGINPASTTLPSARLGVSKADSWIIEPQLNYNAVYGRNRFGFLLGGSVQQSANEGINLTGNNYLDENFLRNIAAAGTILPSYTEARYKYAAVFGRVSYNYDAKYLVNIAIRRDGSSRFGPGRQFANFYSVGGAWIFSEEKPFDAVKSVLSYGKLRGSVGITGNDQIGDYKFMDNWTNGTERYAGVLPVNPVGLFNPDYSWEENRKLELALDLGFLEDRILTQLTFYRNVSDNQLIAYALPVQTGFGNINRNLDARVLNEGWEWTVDSRPIERESFSWGLRFNISFPKNRLVRFPDLDGSSYAGRWILDEPLNIQRLYHYLGVDRETGIYTFEDIDQNDLLNNDDRTKLVHFDPQFYGGITNTFRYRNWQLGFLFDFRKQMGRSYMASLSSAPGYGVSNQPRAVLDRWQEPGDDALFQRYTASVSDPAFTAMTNFVSSDGATSDASFIKLRNINVSYRHTFDNVGYIESMDIFTNAQNVWTLTNYIGADPEIQHMFITPPMRTFVLGVRLNF